MRTRSTVVTTLLLFALAGNAMAQSKYDNAIRKERSSLERSSNPVDRTKIDIRIADLLIEVLAEAARTKDDKLIEQHIKDYAATIQDAQQTMMGTKVDAHKHPAGFKDLEISLRKQQRRLDDISKMVDAEQRDAIAKLKKLASNIDDQIVNTMLLKDANAPRKP